MAKGSNERFFSRHRILFGGVRVRSGAKYATISFALNMPDCTDCFSSYHPNGVQFSFADGQVALISDDTDFSVVQAQATRSGHD